MSEFQRSSTNFAPHSVGRIPSIIRVFPNLEAMQREGRELGGALWSKLIFKSSWHIVEEEGEKGQNLHLLGKSYFLIILLWDDLFIVLLSFKVER